ncbi:hypothetical protein ACHHRT_12715 [Desulfurivibrio sp. D14AmB]|uniref:hypothetical protein n=1 Tax=Desulfurivibrio sp. D14AmB TaxID=3374370 RepID=UPI00376ED43E
MSMVIDTHQMIKRLVGKGLSESVAEEFAQIQKELVINTIATKTDIGDLGKEISHQMKHLENRLTIKFGAMLTVAVGVLGALIKF